MHNSLSILGRHTYRSISGPHPCRMPERHDERSPEAYGAVEFFDPFLAENGYNAH